MKKIGTRAFSYCEKLNEIIVPDSVSEIGERAFSGCPELKFATITNNSITLKNDVFAESGSVVILAENESNAKKYCEDNKLRWSTSKDIEAVRLGNDETSKSDKE